MNKMFVVLLLLFSAVAPVRGIRLDGNGYTNILVAINPDVPESDILIDQIKGMITNGSEYLYQALDNKLYFKEVTILVPPNWNGSTYERARTENYDQAKIIIDKPHPSFGDDPYTIQFGGCGQEGKLIHFTPNFLLNDNPAYGPRGRAFVHEWAHLRWGVYDEYNEKEPFYLSNGNISPTRCSTDISGQFFVRVNGFMRACPILPSGLPAEGCQFYPDKFQRTNASIMYLQSLEAIKAFCNEEDHNRDAPNLQNQKCNSKATRTVIFQDSVDSDVLRALRPLQSIPPAPTFKVIQRGPPVTCLILDVSGSMSINNRIGRLVQAATIFLQEVVLDGEYVGIVSFSTTAKTLSPLVKVDSKETRDKLTKLLPKSPGGSTNMCLGLSQGFKVLRGDDGRTQGDSILFLTDGEATDNIQACLPDAVNSSAIIHTLALGRGASNVLVEMATLTGGKFIFADESLTSNQLVDAFATLRISDGSLNKQTIQLESIGQSTVDWFNGTVGIDRTVGKNTTFTLIYDRSSPSVYIESPNGVVYDHSHVNDDVAAKMITLRVPGVAEVGTWKYSFLNRESAAQGMALTVTSRPVNENVSPVTVNAQMNQTSSDGTRPLVVYAEVKQNFNPILGATVLAILSSDTGYIEHLDLLDNGAGADALKNDGIYSRYFTKLRNGRFSLKVRVSLQDGTSSASVNRHGSAFYVPGVIVNGVVVPNPPKPPIVVDPVDVGNISRTATGESFVVVLPPGVTSVNFPPNKITDLRAEIQQDTVLLNWTAPGEDFDQGRAASYEIRRSENLDVLLNNFSNTNLVNISGLLPQEAGSDEVFFFLSDVPIPNGTTLFFAVQSEDDDSMKSDVSNVARVTQFIPTPLEPKTLEVSNKSPSLAAIVVAVCAVAILIILIATAVWAVKRRKVSYSL